MVLGPRAGYRIAKKTGRANRSNASKLENPALREREEDAASGKVLTPIQVDVAEHFGFPSPATDATGNTFVTYNPGRYDGVIVLVPDADGFEDIGWDDESGNTHYMGRRAIYYADLVGPGQNGEYTIRKSSNDCRPSCAEGAITDQDLHWNGSDYVP
jgi:hypothetical protein